MKSMRTMLSIPRCALLAFIVVTIGACGLGSSSASPRRAAATASWPIHAHIETWAYDDSCNSGASASPSLVRQWLTYAEANCGAQGGKAVHDCHVGHQRFCHSMQYLNTAWQFADQHLPVPARTAGHWFLHEPLTNGHARIYTQSGGGGYLIDQRRPDVRSFFRSYVRSHVDRVDGLLMDWQTPGLSQELSASICGCTRTREIATNRDLQAAHQLMSQVLTHRNGRPFLQVDNTLAPNPFLPQGLNMLNPRIGVVGWVAEGEPMSYGTLDPWYTTLLDQIAYVATRTSGFVVPLAYDYATAPDLDRTRRVQEATMLIGYSPGHLVDWLDLDHGNQHLSVWPEEGIYPSDPVESMRTPGGRGCLRGAGVDCARGGHHDVQVAPGVFRREFRSCALLGRRFGGCAAIINTTGNGVLVQASWLRQAYGHVITWSGGDVQSHGAVHATGSGFTPGQWLDPHDAVLLAS